jgi:hypothetical protein
VCMRKPTPRKLVSVKIHKGLLDVLKVYQRKNGVTLTWMLNTAVNEFIISRRIEVSR